ncbi:MAG: hypothetical protein KDD70_01255 [Bdellovibrionales bacterium]|nr:hypothetical protein [Bdellovibrionales bacterium]
MKLWVLLTFLCLPIYLEAQQSLAPQASSANDWTFTLSPTLGIPAFSGDTQYGSLESLDVDVGLGDTLGNIRFWLDFAAEAFHRPSRFGVAARYSYLSLENSVNSPSRFFSFDADFERAQVELVALYRVFDGASTADLYGGIRNTNISINSTGQDPAGFFVYDTNYDVLDPIIGLRIIPRIAETWSLLLQSDVGLGGDSDTNVSATVGALWQVEKSVALSFLYTANWFDYRDDSDGFLLDAVTHGPMFGFRFTF